MSIWAQLGFRANPYDSKPLKASLEGASLLVGRSTETRELMSQLANTTLHPTLEGPNGVGKTSLVLVTTYQAMESRRSGATSQTFVPIDKVIQIHTDSDRMYRDALLAVAQALIEHRSFLENCGHTTANLGTLEAWLNNPVNNSGGASVTVLGSGGSVDVTREVNPGEGFLASGLERMVKAALTETFPTSEDGGLVGVIDNIELLGRSSEARRVLEELRDTALDLPNVRWVLCGALGIVRSSVTSGRLDGRVGSPIELAPVKDSDVEDLIEARLNYFSTRQDSTAPIGPAEFRHLYRICNNNLRDALKYAQSFSVWLDVQGELDEAPESYLDLLEVWLAEEAAKITASIGLQPRAWQLFDDLVAEGGVCAPSDNEKFGINSPQQMRTYFVALERVNLIKAEVDEDDLRRRTVNVTDKGWVVSYARRGFSS